MLLSAADLPGDEELRHAVDPDARLAGEDPATEHVEDAVHWTRTYSELLDVKRGLIERADQLIAGLSDDAMREANLDQRVLRAQADRFSLRLEFWTRRARELAGADPSPTTLNQPGG